MRRTWWLAMLAGFCVGITGGCASSGEESLEGEPATVREAPSQGSGATPEKPADKPLVNTLKWTTASEVDNFGFDIYRGLSEEGPFDRITDEPLAGAGTTDEPQKYIYVDEEIDPGRDYFYYIESVSLGGIREIFSPIIKAPAKAP